MKTYTPDQLVILDSGQIDQVQKSIDGDALAFLDDKKEELDFLNPEEQAHLKEYYTDTMEKYRLPLCANDKISPVNRWETLTFLLIANIIGNIDAGARRRLSRRREPE